VVGYPRALAEELGTEKSRNALRAPGAGGVKPLVVTNTP
jgi:hypothetical protein